MEEFNGSQINTSLQLQAIEVEHQKVEEEKRPAIVILPDDDYRENTIDKSTRGDNEVQHVTTVPQPPESKPSDPHHTLEVMAIEATLEASWEEPRQEPLREPSTDDRHVCARK